jgi:hypothetical protein
MGDAIHEHQRERAAFGVDEAMRRIHELAHRFELNERETGIFIARCRAFEWTPPPGSFGEVALCLRESGEVERVQGGKGHYDTPPDTVTAGTLDLMWSEPEPLDLTDPTHPRCPRGSVLWVTDYKSGDDAYVDPVESNAQLETEVVLGAKWTGAEMAVPAILFVRKGAGEWDVPDSAWGQPHLREAEARIRATVARVREQQRILDAGAPLEFVEGRHCEFCPAKTRCAAHTGIFKQMFSGVVPFGDAPLTADERQWLAERLSMIESISKRARAVLRADVDENGPIPLSDGNEWGPVKEKRTTILAHVALPIVREELGEMGDHALDTSMTRDSIEGAVREYCEANALKRAVSPTMRRIMAKLGDAGALVDSPRVEYRAHKPERAA